CARDVYDSGLDYW
nr:immunoglobulin heavy chain junction region [Macaca mulatta]